MNRDDVDENDENEEDDDLTTRTTDEEEDEDEESVDDMEEQEESSTGDDKVASNDAPSLKRKVPPTSSQAGQPSKRNAVVDKSGSSSTVATLAMSLEQDGSLAQLVTGEMGEYLQRICQGPSGVKLRQWVQCEW